MPTTAWKFPGTAINSVAGETGSYDWSNPGNITADDGSYAGVILTGFGPSRTLRGSNFGFTSSDIPAGAFITGIEVKIERSASDANRINDTHVYIVPNGSAGSVSDRAGDNKADTVTKWPTSDTAVVYGSSSDTWSAGLTRAQAISSNFAVDLQATTTVGGLANVDYFQVRLTWELPVISAALNVTEASDAIATTGTVKIKGGSALTEAADSLYGRIGFTAVWDWDFTTAALPPEVTFSRSTSGTLIDASGKLTYAPANLFTSSQDAADAAWTKSNLTISADADYAPDGTLTADKLVEASTNTEHYILQAAGTVGLMEVFSVYAKPAGRDWICLRMGGGGSATAYFNVATGTVGLVYGTGTVATIEAAANGYYRCSVKGRRLSTAANSVFCASGNGTVSYNGDGASGLYVWGMQLEPISYQPSARAYLMTTTAAYQGPRFDYDPLSLQCKGLLIEETRVNYLIDSEFADGLPASRSGITAVAFAGLTMGTGLSLQNANPSTTYFYVTNYAVPASSQRVISIFVRMDDGGAPSFGSPSNSSPLNDFVFNLGNTVLPPVAANGGMVEDYGGGLYRVSMAVVTTTVSPNSNCGVIKYPGNSTRGFSCSGIMVEAGNDVTSYAPTGSGSGITRSADAAAVSGTSFSDKYNPNEGTLIVDWGRNSLATGGARGLVSLDDGTTAQRMLVYADTVGRAYLVNGSPTGPFNLGTFPERIRQSIALAYAAGDFAGTMNGRAPQTAAATPPTVDRMNIGGGPGLSVLNGHIKRIRYYDARMPNSEMQAGTALQGNATIVETGDTLAADAKAYIKAAVNKIEATDALTATAQVYVKATLNKIEATDALSSAATVRIKGTLARTEANDAVSAQAKAYIRATVTIGEAGDTLTAAADAGPRAVASERRTIILLGAPLSGRTVELTGSRLADRTIII
ncbi:hypothetical protein GG804_12860 [Sphingomonas histidinilytica]|uniref:phage head spike fiber domain-containing protein n=1 Tax=Rhizorhabdus histidinilytica TaxID=439228 RepID=UPI001ADCC859|nr:hypothetical protein [Rhizorhabdus histidinilytica]MBO9377660.1 hypothetical protein [Rhizorhabdus histidinilytica]